MKENSIKNLESYSIFASYRIGDFPRAGLKFHPWDITETKAILINAYDFIANPRTTKIAREWESKKQNVSDSIEFSGPIMMDSGAYNFIKQGDISITPTEVLDIAIAKQSDFGVVLDHPFPPNLSADEIEVRIQTTKFNTEIMVEYLRTKNPQPENFELIPVIHGHDEKTIEKFVEDLNKILGEEPKFVGIGSLAPLAQNGSKTKIVDVISTVRKLLPKSHIHCFSMGSALQMLLAFYCGADTVDSQTWIMSAAFKQVQLPGSYLTRLSKQEEEKNRKFDELKKKFALRLLTLTEEENFVIKNWETKEDWKINSLNDAYEYIDFLMDENKKNNIHRRACHNLYTFNFEAKKVRELSKKSQTEFENFIQKRLIGTIYNKPLKYALEHKNALNPRTKTNVVKAG